MKLLVAELVTELYQELTCSEDQDIQAIRLHLYKHNTAAGSLSVVVTDSNGRTIATSDSVAISDISASAFYHGYIKFPIVCSLKEGTVFRVYLRQSGYTFSEGSYVGWCNDFDLRKYSATYSPNTGTRAALDCELWGYKELVR